VFNPRRPALERRTGGHAMKNDSTHATTLQAEPETAVHVFDDWSNPIEEIGDEKLGAATGVTV
jgi:hypothetical protein